MRTLAFVLMLVLLTTVSTHGAGSLLEWVDRQPSILSDLWPDRMLTDPFKILEQMPISALEKNEDIWFAPAKVDWKETPEGHVITMDLPGLKKEEVKVEVEQNRVLRVSGQRKREEQKGDHWHRSERCHGKFWRQFRLPENVDLDSVKAKLEDGVLKLKVSKLSHDKIEGPKMVRIEGVETQSDAQAKITGEGNNSQEL